MLDRDFKYSLLEEDELEGGEEKEQGAPSAEESEEGETKEEETTEEPAM